MNLFLYLSVKKDCVLKKPIQKLVWISNCLLSLYASAV